MRAFVVLIVAVVLVAVQSAALAQSLRIFGDDETQPQFNELDVKLPPPPKSENLVRFQPSAANPNEFFVDGSSISVGSDGVVRYTMVVTSPSGAQNVSYEGIRCETTEQKSYAFGRRDGTWSAVSAAEWKKIQYKDVNRQHGVLYSNYFCPDGAPIRSAQDAIQRMKYGVPYGQPPRSSNGRY